MNRLEAKRISEVVGMDDSVEVALRRKKDSSMRVAIELVKAGQADQTMTVSDAHKVP